MNRRILLGSYEFPTYGGASTEAYRLFKSLQAKSIDATYVSFFSTQTWQWWAAQHAARLEFIGADVILLQKQPGG